MQRKNASLLLFILIMLALTPCIWAVQHQYSPAKIVDVEHKTRQKVDMYLVNTPVGHEVPYYEITVRMNHFDYTAEYTPHHDEELPSEWAAGADVSARLEKHVLFLKRSDGSELRWIITKRHPVSEKQE